MSTSAPVATSPAHPDVPRRGAERIGALDVLRGLAIVAVVGYHLAFDLHTFDLAGDLTGSPAGTLVGRGIAAVFLLLVGVSMALAHPRGLRPAAFWRREATLLAAGGVVTAVSVIAAPAHVITFGILQDIAVTSVLLVPFLRSSRLAAAGAALAAVVLPHLVPVASGSRWLTWTGLTTATDGSLDYQPVLPLLSVSLVGLIVGRTFVQTRRPAPAPAAWKTGPAARSLRWLGRRTLTVYLLHQPVLYAVLWLLTR